MSLIGDYLKDLEKSKNLPNGGGMSSEKLSLIKPKDNFFISPINPRPDGSNLYSQEYFDNTTDKEKEEILSKKVKKKAYKSYQTTSLSNINSNGMDKTCPSYDNNPTNDMSVCSLQDLKRLRKLRRRERLKSKVDQIVENLLSGKYKDNKITIDSDSKLGRTVSLKSHTVTSEKDEYPMDPFKVFDPRVRIDANLNTDPTVRKNFLSYDLQVKCFGNDNYRTNFLKGIYDYRDQMYFRIHSKYNIDNFQNFEKEKYKKMYNDFIDRNYFKPEKRFCFSMDKTHDKFRASKEAKMKAKNDYTLLHLAMKNGLSNEYLPKEHKKEIINVDEKLNNEDLSDDEIENNKKEKEKEKEKEKKKAELPDIYAGKSIEEKINICYSLAMKLKELPRKRNTTFRNLFPSFKKVTEDNE